jgi:hypothetical protein
MNFPIIYILHRVFFRVEWSFNEFWSYYTIGGRAKIFSKFFLEMTLLGVKTGEESEFDIFEAKKRFPDSGRPVY